MFATSEPERVRGRTRTNLFGTTRSRQRLALADQGLPNDAATRFVASGAKCTDPAITPRLTPGAEFTVCVTRRVQLPAVPTVLTGRGIRTVGMYLVHVDDFRQVRR